MDGIGFPAARTWRRAVAAGLLAGAWLLTGCAEEPPPRTDFPPLSFDYLPKIRLNVATVDVDPAWQPATVANGAHVEPLSPVSPVAALRQMVQTRLVPVGASGHAVVVIEDASFIQRGGQYEGNLQLHLDVTTSDGAHSGYAKATVTATRTLVEDLPAAARAALYDLVKRMMADMNAEFEYQIRKSLREYLETGAIGAPPAEPVQSQDLPGSAPGPSTPGPSTPGPAAPGAAAPGPAAPPAPALDALPPLQPAPLQPAPPPTSAGATLSPPPGNLAAPTRPAPTPLAPTPLAPPPATQP